MTTDRGKRILIVDDDEAFCIATSHVLTDAGFIVRCAQGAHEALHLIEAGEGFDLLLTDVRMQPGQPHGFTLARLARSRLPKIKIIYITGYPDLAENDPAAAELGAVLGKPARAPALLAEVRRALAP